MEIVSRHKDVKGNTLGYTVSSNGIKKYIAASVALSNFGSISNASLLSNGEFRAHRGYTIDTVVETKELMVQKRKIQLPKITPTIINNDYYGNKYINICKKIRKYACNQNIVLDEKPHEANAGASIHMFRLIDACGINRKDFIVGYLSNIQPYSLEKFQSSRELSNNNIWVCDIGYKIKLLIKINDTDINKPIIVSFHESNIHGSNSFGQVDFSDKQCAVIVDSVNTLHNGYGVDYIVQRGFIKYSIHSTTTEFSNGVALVNYKDIKQIFDDTMNLLFDKLQSVYLDNNNNTPVINTRHSINGMSFMSVGFGTVNNISLMLDLYNKFTDSPSRASIVEITTNIISEMPKLRQQELKIALGDKYKSSYNNKLYLAIDSML